jgi:hypothetical protein
VRSPRRGDYAIIVDYCVSPSRYRPFARSTLASRRGRDQKWLLRPAPARPAAAGCAAAGGRPRVDLGASVERWNPAAYPLRARAARGRSRSANGTRVQRRGVLAQVHLHAYTDRSTEPRRRQVLIGLLRLETLAQPSQPCTLSISTGGRASRPRPGSRPGDHARARPGGAARPRTARGRARAPAAPASAGRRALATVGGTPLAGSGDRCGPFTVNGSCDTLPQHTRVRCSVLLKTRDCTRDKVDSVRLPAVRTRRRRPCAHRRMIIIVQTLGRYRWPERI